MMIIWAYCQQRLVVVGVVTYGGQKIWVADMNLGQLLK